MKGGFKVPVAGAGKEAEAPQRDDDRVLGLLKDKREIEIESAALPEILGEIELENGRADRYNQRMREALETLSKVLAKRLSGFNARIRDPIPFLKTDIWRYYLVLDRFGLHYALYDGTEERFFRFTDMPREQVVILYSSGRIIEFLKHVAQRLRQQREQAERWFPLAERIEKFAKELEVSE